MPHSWAAGLVLNSSGPKWLPFHKFLRTLVLACAASGTAVMKTDSPLPPGACGGGRVMQTGEEGPPEKCSLLSALPYPLMCPLCPIH